MQTNGKWQLAFWVIAIIAGTWLVALTQGVVNNYYRGEDKRAAILEKIERLTTIANDTLHVIDLRLTRIEERLDISAARRERK